MPFQPINFNSHTGFELYRNDIARPLSAHLNRLNAVPVPDDPFRKQKSDRQFPVVTRCAHGNRDAPAHPIRASRIRQPDLKRFFDRHTIVRIARIAAFNFPDDYLR